MMSHRLTVAALLLALAAPAAAQSPTRAQLDSVRTELNRSRAFIRGADTQLTKTMLLVDSLIAALDTAAAPPPPDTTSPPPPPVDPSVTVFAQSDFSVTGRLSPFTTYGGVTSCDPVTGACPGGDTSIRNGRAEILYERLNTSSAGDRNRGVKWTPIAGGAQNIPHGGTIYIAGTWTIPSVTPEARAKIDSAAAALGLPYQTETEQQNLQRKLIYVNPGTTNHWILKLQNMALQWNNSVGGPEPCSPTAHAQPIGFGRLTPEEVFDKPLRIEILVKRSSGVRVPDGEVTVWVNGVLKKTATGICTNEDTNTRWVVRLGDQVSYSPGKADLYSELRLLDDVLIANKRPF